MRILFKDQSPFLVTVITGSILAAGIAFAGSSEANNSGEHSRSSVECISESSGHDTDSEEHGSEGEGYDKDERDNDEAHENDNDECKD